jgi:hypothetical protein
MEGDEVKRYFRQWADGNSEDPLPAHERTADTRVLKMLYEGNMAEANRREVQQRKSWIANHKHEFYRQTGKPRRVPKVRTWLGGSAGSGKSTTLKTIVQHVRLIFQREGVAASVELTAYTGVAAFNIGFGAKTACSSFQIFPKAQWKKELEGDALRRLEEQWQSVILLIVDEISFIGRAFFARMHFRVQQGRRRFFSEAALDPNEYEFGDISIILVGDFGQLEPIEDLSLCDTETTFQTCAKVLKPLWRHIRFGKDLLGIFDEAIMLRRIHRSKADMWWTESCLRLRDFSGQPRHSHQWAAEALSSVGSRGTHINGQPRHPI